MNELLGGGGGGALDVDDMRAHTAYAGGYSATSTAVKHFWAVVAELAEPDKRALLRFATSVSRPPLGGFRHLAPPLTIQKVDCAAAVLGPLGRDVDRLPSASTCSNTLRLPNYRRKATLRERLTYAIRAGAGFELS